MSTENNDQAKLKRLNNRIAELEKRVKEAQAAYNKNPLLENNLELCMANLDLADAKAKAWLLSDKLKNHQMDEQGSQPGE